MEKNGLVDDLEKLQAHPNKNIYEHVLKIIEMYFQEEEGGLDKIINQALEEHQQNMNPTANTGLFDLWAQTG